MVVTQPTSTSFTTRLWRHFFSQGYDEVSQLAVPNGSRNKMHAKKLRRAHRGMTWEERANFEEDEHDKINEKWRLHRPLPSASSPLFIRWILTFSMTVVFIAYEGKIQPWRQRHVRQEDWEACQPELGCSQYPDLVQQALHELQEENLVRWRLRFLTASPSWQEKYKPQSLRALAEIGEIRLTDSEHEVRSIRTCKIDAVLRCTGMCDNSDRPAKAEQAEVWVVSEVRDGEKLEREPNLGLIRWLWIWASQKLEEGREEQKVLPVFTSMNEVMETGELFENILR